jgi:hypothetical protein
MRMCNLKQLGASALYKFYRLILPLLLPSLLVVSLINDLLSPGRFDWVLVCVSIGLGLFWAFLLLGFAKFDFAHWDQYWLEGIRASNFPRLHILNILPSIISYIAFMSFFAYLTVRIFSQNLEVRLFLTFIISTIVTLPLIAAYIRFIINFWRGTLR